MCASEREGERERGRGRERGERGRERGRERERGGRGGGRESHVGRSKGIHCWKDLIRVPPLIYTHLPTTHASHPIKYDSSRTAME